VLRARSNVFAVLALSAVALGAAIAGCSTSNTPNPTITAPPIASQSFTPTPIPTVTVTPTHGPTPTPTPTSTSTGGGDYTLAFVPPSLTLTDKTAQSVEITDVCPPPSVAPSCSNGVADSLTTIVSNSCGTNPSTQIASVDATFAEYGIYAVTAGPVNGPCSFTVQNVDNSPSDPWKGKTATEPITNSSNVAKPRRQRVH
jgi:hypothetical protein